MLPSLQHWAKDSTLSSIEMSTRTEMLTKNQCPGRHLAQQVASAWLEVAAVYLADNNLSFKLASEAQPALSLLPSWWAGKDGDGRGRGGREKIWPVSDIILTVKVSHSTSLSLDRRSRLTTQGGLWVQLVESKGH